MLFCTLTKRLQELYPEAKTDRLSSGQLYTQLLTADLQHVDLLPQTLANSLNLIEEGLPLAHAIHQLDMHLRPADIDIESKLADNCSIILCELSCTYVLVCYGMYLIYVDELGNTYNCWSQANVRNDNK